MSDIAIRDDAATSAAPARKFSFKPIVQVGAGNALEIYDFMIYGYYATYIAKSYFPTNSDFVSLMLSLMTFAFGFLARPIGAIVLGSYADRHGRRKGLLLALGLMSVGIIVVACTPSYSQIGIVAPLNLVPAKLKFLVGIIEIDNRNCYAPIALYVLRLQRCLGCADDEIVALAPNPNRH